jgi:hypothetical protein
MRALLWEKWDPLAVREIAPDDEYDGYARVLAGKLQRGDDRGEIADYLARALDEDRVITPAWTERCNRTAQALLDWYEQANAPRKPGS